MPDTSAGIRLRHWLQAPRYLLLLFLATTLGFLVGLGGLGWRAIEQDRLAAESRAADYSAQVLAETTDQIALDVSRELSELEAHVERYSTLPDDQLVASIAPFADLLPDDAMVVVFERGLARAFPRDRLLYYPALPVFDELFISPGLPPRTRALVQSDPEAVLDMLEQSAAEAGDIHARAEALMELARAQRNLGYANAALATSEQVTDPDALIAGRPAELLARAFRCELLASLGHTAALREELERFARDLHGGRWLLVRTVYQSWTNELARLARGVPGVGLVEPGVEARALASGVDWLWRQWEDGESAIDAVYGLSSRVLEDQTVLFASRATRSRLVALVAGPSFLEGRIIGSIRQFVDARAARVVLHDGARVVLEYGTVSPDQRDEIRTQDRTGLPWTLTVFRAPSLPPPDAAEPWRRQLIVFALIFLALFVVAGSYLSVRAVTREIEAARLKTDFVAAVSHEFRTPLTLLRQFSDLLAENRVSNEQERQRYYAALQRGTRRLTRLVEDLLDFGRMEAGSRGYAVQPVAAREWLRALTDEFHDDVCSKGFTIDVTWTGPPATVDADEAALGRALWNLLDNAVKYSPSCQTVWVEGRFEDGRLLVSVRDRGIGVPPRERRAIFRKFVRGSAGGGPPIRGTGLGLALVQQIVEAHGGCVHLESVVGEGSTFTLDLPAREAVDAGAGTEEPRQWRVS